MAEEPLLTWLKAGSHWAFSWMLITEGSWEAGSTMGLDLLVGFDKEVLGWGSAWGLCT